MRRLRVYAVAVALLVVGYWLRQAAPAPEQAVLRAEPRIKQLPRVRAKSLRPAPQGAMLVASEPLPEPEPDEVWLRVENGAGEPLEQVSVTLRKVGDEFREPVDLASIGTDANGLGAIPIEPFANLAPEEEAELVIEVIDYTSKRVPESELMSALGSPEPYRVVLDPTQTVTLAMRCPADSETPIYLGWYTDDGVEVQRFESYCDDGLLEVEELALPLVPLHFVAVVADPEAPRLGLRAYHAASSPEPQRIEIALAPYALAFRSVRLVDGRGVGVSDTLVEPALHVSPGALLDRWLNRELLTTDAEGRFDWVSARGRSSRLAITPPGFSGRRELELRAGTDIVRLDGVAMVRCHFLGAGGEPLYFRGFDVSAESRTGEVAGWMVSAGDDASAGQASFAWPEEARLVTITSLGFAPVQLRSPHAPCVLNATPEYVTGRRPRIRL